MLSLITTKTKDDVLRWLCHNAHPGQLTQINLPAIISSTSADYHTVRVIIEDFQDMGLVENLILAEEDGSDIILTLKVRAHTFLQRGGFVIEDALNEANIQKILFDLENLQKQLKPDQLDAFNKIASIASSIATVLVPFFGKN